MTEIQKHMMRTFVTLRIGVGAIGIVFPWLLVIGGAHYHVPFADSMSAYYHASAECPDPPPNPQSSACEIQGNGPMRNWFVGILFFIGTAIYAIKGFSRWENWLLNIAAIGSLGVALNPMPWPENPHWFSIHYACAITFFVACGLTCVLCADKTLDQFPNSPNREKLIKWYKNAYRVLAFFMIGAPLCTLVISRWITHKTFYLEVAGVTAFGIFLLVKTSELKRSEVERRVLEGSLKLNPRTLR